MSDVDPGASRWEQRLMKRIQSNPKKRRSEGKWGTAISFSASLELRHLLAKVCQERDINRSGYIRRAVVRQVARDLNMPVQEVLRLTPKPTRWGVTAAPRVQKGVKGAQTWEFPPDDGTGFGRWEW